MRISYCYTHPIEDIICVWNDRIVICSVEQMISSDLSSSNKPTQYLLMKRYKKEDAIPSDYQDKTTESSRKITISFPSSQVHTYDEEETNDPVSIYLYAPSKKSVKVEVPPKILMQDIKKIVEERIKIKTDRQLLYLNGKNVTEYGYVRLMNNNIIHALDSDNLCSRDQPIRLNLTVLNFLAAAGQPNCKTIRELTVAANDSVQDFVQKLQQQLKAELAINNPSAHLYLLQSSRLLEKNKSFADQDITQHSTIIGIITENELKTRFSNDTKEEILHDISELLGFEEKAEQPKHEPVTEQKSIRPRFKPKEPRKVYPVEQSSEGEEDPYGLLAAKSLHTSVTLPNFKKKPNPLHKSYSFDGCSQPLATKLKSSKSKKDLEKMMNSQAKQAYIFDSPDVIKEIPKEQQQSESELPNKQQAKQSESKRPSPQIPKTMPIKERRQIRLEIEKLFEFQAQQQSAGKQSAFAKEETSPISPPTETVSISQKPKDSLRLSLGARPLFLDQTRVPPGKQEE